VYAAVGAAPVDAGAGQRTLLVAGTFLGSAAWFAVLTAIVVRLRAHLTQRTLATLNTACSIVIAAFGIAAIGWALLQRG
jgi:arginine exporter protein ArgO